LRAAVRERSGQPPRANTFSWPPKRYFSRRSFPPAGVTSRWRPPVSPSF
jgi:hypothetical protein